MKESNINAGGLFTVPQVGVFGLVVRVTQSMGPARIACNLSSRGNPARGRQLGTGTLGIARIPDVQT